MIANFHLPVMVDAVLELLITRKDGVYVDGTLGGGGHAEKILENLSPQGKLIGFDVDSEAMAFAQNRLRRFGDQVIYFRENFSNIRSVTAKLNPAGINGLLLDLGISSHQVDDPVRGFSFQTNNRLDMRMDQDMTTTGQKIINEYSQEQLTKIFQNFGEERFSRRIAKNIVNHRLKKMIETTGELSNIVEYVVGKRFLNKSLARIFQAIRIEVNEELYHLQRTLSESLGLLIPGGRMAVISYHSLEDRIVKNFFKKESETRIPSGNKLLPDKLKEPVLSIITKKPIIASEKETMDNPRARSAKLRVAERL